MHLTGEADLAAGPTSGPSGRARLRTRTRRSPSLALFVTEPARGAVEFATLPLARPWLALAPRGDGHGVLVLPGLMADDASTRPLRAYLRRLGYYTRGWRLGRNLGPTEQVLDGLPRALHALAERTGGPVSVIGWSLGGIFARELGRDHPDQVRQVITLGSPFALVDPRQSRADRAFHRRDHLHAPPARLPSRERIRRPIPVPSTAVYSRLDGIVSWRACVEPTSDTHQNVAVRCSHLGFGVDPATFWLTADRLARPAQQWRPFEPPRWLRTLYPVAR
jgi:pimeloyl-ACP methyl ester carboxylesterase